MHDAHDGALSGGFYGSIRGRLAKGLLANGAGFTLNLANRIALPPLFLSAWGSEIYGAWLVLSSVAAYLSMSDLGGQVYIVNRMTQAFSSGNVELFRTIVRTGITIFLILPAVLLAVFISIMGFVPVGVWFDLGSIGEGTARVVLAVIAIQFLISLPQGLLLGVYRAVGLYARGMMLGNLILLGQLILTAILLLSEYGIFAVAASQVIPYLVVSAIAVYDLKRRFPELRITSLGHADWEMALSFVKPSLHFLIIQLSQMLSNQGALLAVGAAMDAVHVVMFSTLRTMIMAGRQLLSLLSHAAWPEFTRLESLRDRRRLRYLFAVIFAATLVGTLVIAAILYFFGETVYNVWLRGQVPFDHVTLNVLLIYLCFHIIWTSSSHLLMATNRHEVLARAILYSSALGIILAYAGAVQGGLAWAVVGLMVGELLFVGWYAPLKVVELLWK